MANSPSASRVVLDSNVLIAAHRSAHLQSPNRELMERWQANEFTFLFSRDTLHEYAEKLLALGMERADVIHFIALAAALGEAVEIEFFHLPHYPVDPDDIAFLLCAWNAPRVALGELRPSPLGFIFGLRIAFPNLPARRIARCSSRCCRAGFDGVVKIGFRCWLLATGLPRPPG